MEDMPSSCFGSDSGNYAVRHNPFVYYSSIVNNATRCARVVPGGNAGATLVNDLGSTTTASNYMWFTPNICNDMHDCSVAAGDTYMASLVGRILNTTVFTAQRAALFVTFDEGYGPPIYSAWAGPAVKLNYTSTTAYNHYSLLATIEANWNLPSLRAEDGGATSMDEFFTGQANPNFSLSASSGSLSLAPNQTGSATISLRPTGGFTGSVTLSASSSPAGLSVSCSPLSISGSGTSTCTFMGTTAGSYTVTITGANGNRTIVRTALISVDVAAPGPPSNPLGVTLLIGLAIGGLIPVAALVVILARRRNRGPDREP